MADGEGHDVIGLPVITERLATNGAFSILGIPKQRTRRFRAERAFYFGLLGRLKRGVRVGIIHGSGTPSLDRLDR